MTATVGLTTAMLLVPSAVPPTSAAPEDVIAAGRVFEDHDGDGAFDDDATDGFLERGVGNVTVTVTDALGRSATTRTERVQAWQPGDPADTPENPNDPTDPDVVPGHWYQESDGTWSMTEQEFADQTGSAPFVAAGTATARLRVTFSDVPAHHESWFAGDGAQNDTSVQFVAAGDDTVDYGVLRPEDHRTDPFDLVTAIQSAGDPQDPGSADRTALRAADWSTSQDVHYYQDLNKNGSYDEGTDTLAPSGPDGDEYGWYDDRNGDGFWDADEPGSDVSFVDENGNGIWDAGPWSNATLYDGVDAVGPTRTVEPQRFDSVRVLHPDGECWTGPFVFAERLTTPQTVPDDPSTEVDESTSPRAGAFAATDVEVNCYNFTGTVSGIFVPAGGYDGEPRFTQARTVNLTEPSAPRDLATFGELGSVWGNAYEKTSNTYLLSALYKRVSGLAEHRWGGDTDRALGAVYRIPDVLDPASGRVADDIGPAGSVEPWFSLTDLGIDVGSVPSNADRGIGAPTDEVADPDAFANAGKVGIGGIDTWTDGFTTYLYVMNLADRDLYRIDITPTSPDSPDHDPGFVPTAADVLRIPLGLGESERPWAVEVYGDEVFVGWADTGQAPGNCATTGSGEPDVDGWPACDSTEPLHARAAKLSLDGGSPEQVLDVDLGYPRGDPINGWGGQGSRYSNQYPQVRHWNSWADEWTWDAGDTDGNGWPDGSAGLDVSAGTGWSSGHHIQVYPQAILSSLTFDSAGFMTLGLTDRTELQAGNIQWAADVGQDDGTSPDIHFEAVSAGDMLLAGRDADGTFTPEHAARATGVGADGETTERFDSTPVHREPGPGGFEFYADDQALDGNARGFAQELNHEESALGAVLEPPGATEVVTTAFDPLVNVRVQGFEWMTVDDGAPDRGVELTTDPGESTLPSPSFQKGGGLGDLDALALPAPVEIGNRVWFDADQDGLQSADEPGLGGIEVELVDTAGDVVATQTTADDGTYYFSSREADTEHFAPLEFGDDYTVRFVRPADGTLTVDLWGTAVTAPWSAVPFTATQVTAGDNPHDETDNADGVGPRPDPMPDAPEPADDPDRHDSNPGTTDGEYAFTLGGPGENDHSIDAGFLAWAPLRVEKLFDDQGSAPAPGSTFDLTLRTSDFRGLVAGPQDRDEDAAFTFGDVATYPGNAGLVTDVDPDGAADGVLTVRVGGDGTVPPSTVWFPIGTTVEVSETAGEGVEEVTYTPEGPVTLVDGDDTDGVATVQVTNRLAPGATFTVVKSVTGGSAGDVPDGTTFGVEYSTDGGATWTELSVPYDADGDGSPAPAGSPEFPPGTEILLCETDLPPPPDGVEWGDPRLSGDGVTVDPETGCAAFTVGEAGTTVELGLENVATPAPGDFEVVKTVTGDAADDVPPGTTFPVEWTTTPADPGSWQTLDVPVGEPVSPEGTFPAGTPVTVREGPLPEVDGVVWGAPVFVVGTGEPATGQVTFTVGPDALVEVSLENTAEPEPGGFSVTKTVTGAAAGTVPTETVFTLEYSTDGGETWTPIEVSAGGIGVPAETFEPGTEVLVREAEPLPEVPGVEWGAPRLLVDGEPAGSPATIVIRPGDEPAVGIDMVNTAEAVPGSFTLTKEVHGEAAADVPPGTGFTVEYTVDGGAPVEVSVPAGETLTVDGVPAGAEVTVSEVTFPQVPGVEWESPVLSVDGVAVQGDSATFTVGAADGVAVGISNTASRAPGRVSVTKVVTGQAAELVPEGTEFAVEYSLDGGETWGAATVPLGQVVTSPDLPAGTEVLFREGELPDVDGVEWGEPVVDPASVTVGSGATVEVTMTNTAAPEPGSFTVAKLVDGEAAAQVPPGAGFTIEYSVDGGGTWEPVTVPAGGTTVSSGDLPAGTQVMVRETGDRPDVPGVTWGDVTLEVDGGPVDGDTATFTVGSGEVVAVVATNTAEYLPGTFSVAKVVEGDAADAVPPGTGFTVEYTVDGEAATATVVVGEPWPSPELEHGAEVTVTEVGLPEVDGVVWGEPVLAVDGVPVEGEATFTVEAGTEIGVVLTNTAAPEAGRFQVSKAVDGEAADDVPGGTRFLLEYSTDGGATWLPLVVTADGTPVASPDVPAGTEIVVRETVARDEVPGVGWTGVRFVVDGTPVPGGLDQATFTVEAGGVVEIVVVNTAGPTPPEPTPSPTPSPPEPTPTPTEPTPGPSELTPSPSATAPGPPGPDGPGPDTPGPPGTPLPITGATGTLLLIVAAAAAVLVGGTLIAVRRRRDT